MNLKNKSKMRNKDSELAGAILKVVAFFDMFDCPLTGFEIWKYLPIKCGLAEVDDRLAKLADEPSGKIQTKNGFYFLSDREELYNIRMARYNFTGIKFKPALKITKLFKLIPWIKMIAVTNIIGAGNAKAGSDIDLFIVTENGRLWLTRFGCLLMLKILGLRPTATELKNKICLSFFVSEQALALKKLMLVEERKSERLIPVREVINKVDITLSTLSSQADEIDDNFLPGGENPPTLSCQGVCYGDIYFVYWLANLWPIYDRERVYDKLIASNDWLKPALPNWEAGIVSRWRLVGKPVSFFYHDLLDMFLGGLERFFEKTQIKRLPSQIKDMMNQDTRVVINKKVIKTHTNDRREFYQKTWEEKVC